MPLAIDGLKVCSKPDCPYLGQPQPIANFSNHSRYADGKQPQCKTCLNLANAKYRQTEARKQSVQRYNQSEKGQTRKNFYQKTSEKHKASQKRYNQSEKGLTSKRHQDQKSALKYKIDPEFREKLRARGNVSYHVRVGNIPPVSEFICSQCNECQAEEYHHHLGYERKHWLDIKPVCIPCHRNLEPELF